MKHKNSHFLVGYWSRLREGRALPHQNTIDPKALKRVLPYVFVLESADETCPHYRLAGTSVCARFGGELKGTGFLQHWERDTRGTIALLLRQALRMKQPLAITAIGATADCRMAEIEIVLCPIAGPNGKETRFLGMVQILGDSSLLAGRSFAYLRLAGSALVRENEPLEPHDDTPAPPPPFENLRIHPRAPHLRLVVSQDQPEVSRFDSEGTFDRVLGLFGRSLSGFGRPA